MLPSAIASHRRGAAIFERLAAEDPAMAVYRRRLGQVVTDLGRTLANAGRADEAIVHLGRSVATLEQITIADPAVSSFQRALAEGLDVRGLALARLGRYDEAMQSLARARALIERLMTEYPDFIAYQSDLAENALFAGAIHQDLGRSAEARCELKKARDLLGKLPPGGEALYDLARAESRLAALAPPGTRDAQAERAMAALRGAIARSYRAVGVLRTDPDLDPLRSRPDFQGLLHDLPFPDDPFARPIGRKPRPAIALRRKRGIRQKIRIRRAGPAG